MSDRNPVLLIHGLNDTEAVFHIMSNHLRQQGWPVHSLSLTPSNGDVPLESLAAQVANYITHAFAPGEVFDLIGFSMGGIVSRYYLQRLGGLARVQRFVTISSPHRGTVVAYGSLRPGCMQMRPNSPFLEDLNRDLDRLRRVDFTSIWTPLDLMIVPANSSQIPVAKDIQVWVPAHAWMVSHRQTLQAVTTTLKQPLIRAVV